MSLGAGIAYAGVDYDPFAEAPIERVLPSTESQREVWLADQISLDASLAYNESVTLTLRGALDTEALVRAVHALVDRHESLRATFGSDGTTMCIATSMPLEVARTDLAGAAPDARAAAFAGLLRDEVEQPFDLAHGPLLRVRLVGFGATDHALVLTAHHIVCDGWSFGVIVKELGVLYARECGHGVALPTGVSFSAFAGALTDAQHMADCRASADWWTHQFLTVPPALDLPTDRPRGPRRTFASERLDHVIDAAFVARARQWGASRGVNLYAVLLSGFAAVLHRIAGNGDIVIGVPAAGQAEPPFHGVVGHCVNLLPLRLRVDANAPLAALATTAQAALLDATEHQNFTFGSLLKALVLPRDPARLPLVSVMFNLDQALDTAGSAFPGLELDFRGNARAFENFELFVNAVQDGGGLRLECQYNRDLFDAASVGRWMDGFESMLGAAIASPAAALGALPVVTPGDRATLATWNDTAHAFPRDALVHELIEAQAARAPDRIAIMGGSVQLSYASLEARAQRIAEALRQRGVGAGALVGLCLEREVDMLAAMLGVLKSGAAYVPLDPGFPADRIAYMVADARLAVLVTRQALALSFGWQPGECLLLDAAGAPALVDVPAAATTTPAWATAESPAYVIYTSGSTGKPKGVVVPHRAVVNFLGSMARRPGMQAGDTLVAVTTLSFDIAVTELLLPLTVGARIVLAGREEAGDPGALRALIERHGVNVMQATPATWRMLLESGWSGSPGFKALCGGEPLGTELARQLAANSTSLWNMYGPTETTVWSTAAEVPRNAATIDIGRPIDNTSVWVLDERMQQCPIGVPGEIVIGGAGVTLGYLHRPELTAERFIGDPFSAVPGARLYRTGDRGRWRNDGRLEHLGRNDNQVKVRGYRIEPGEIEAALLESAAVAECVVVAREDRPGDVRLVAYLVLRAGATCDDSAMRLQLRTTLPEYMVPQQFVLLPAVPRLPNGKTDRQSLPSPLATVPARRAAARQSPTERAVAEAMEQALALPGLADDDDFFAMGGHSLLAAQMAATLSAKLGRRIPMRAIFDAPSIRDLSAWLDAEAALPPGAPGPAMLTAAVPSGAAHAAGPTEAPASLMQQRLWFLEQLLPGLATYNTPSAHRLTGPMDVPALERSFNAMVARQGALRTSLRARGGEPYQHIEPVLDVTLQPVNDLSHIDEPERLPHLLALLQGRAAAPINMRVAPLFRVGLYRLAENDHVLFFMPHHAVWDGWSFDLFYAEMSELYAAFSTGREPALPELTVTYADFARWQPAWVQGSDVQHQLGRWKARLTPIAAPLALPCDRPRPDRMSGRGATLPITGTFELTERTRSFSAQHGATVFMTLLSCYAVWLHHLSGQRDIVIGTPIRGRHAAEVENVMGFFVNALPLRVTIDPEQSFVQLLAHVRAVVLDAFSAQDVPIERLVQELGVARDESRSPVYQAFFSYQDARARATDWGALRQTQLHLFQTGASEDIGVWLLEHPQGLAGGLTYNADILLADTAQRMAARYLALVAAVLDDPQRAVGAAHAHAPPPGLPAVGLAGTSQPARASSQADTPLPVGPVSTEQRVARIWQEVLGLDGVELAPSDNFFDLGGHSLLAMRVVAQMEAQLGLVVPVRRLIYESLAQVAATAGAGDAPEADSERAPANAGLFSRMLGRFGRRA